MEKKNYNAPAIDIVRVQTESSLAAGTTIPVSPDEAGEPAGSKVNDFFDEDDE